MAEQGQDQEEKDESPAGESAQEQTRRQFREALARKQERHHATAEAAERDGSDKSHGATGPTKGRTFRRKSG